MKTLENANKLSFRSNQQFEDFGIFKRFDFGEIRSLNGLNLKTNSNSDVQVSEAETCNRNKGKQIVFNSILQDFKFQPKAEILRAVKFSK